jgi:hypothetical protein
MMYAYLDFYSASSLKQLSVGKRIISLGHIILFPSQPVFVLTPQSCCSVEKQQVPMFQSLVWHEGGTDPRSSTHEGGTDPRSTTHEGGTDPRSTTLEGGTDPRSTTHEGGTDPRSTTLETNTLTITPHGV